METVKKDVQIIKPAIGIRKDKLLRVAAYFRVSTDSEDQINSFVAQVKYYNDFIKKNYRSTNMIKLLNCNNIESGEISIISNHLNIKYGSNDTGKSTISNAINAKINNNDSALKALVPFKYKVSGTVIPEVQGVENFNSVKVVNEEYVNSYAFQRDELIKNSFEVFIKTPEYDEHMNKISELLKTIHCTFTSDDTLQSLF